MRFSLKQSVLVLVCAFSFLLSGLLSQAFAARYLVTILGVKVAAKKSSYQRWDTGFGKMPLPDLYVQLDIAGSRLQTRLQKNTLSATWKSSKTFTLTGSEKVYLQVIDKDGFSNDTVGKTNLSFASFSSKTTLAFGKVLALTYKVEALDKKPAARQAAAPAKPAAPAARPTVVVIKKPAKPAAPAKPVAPAKPAAPVKPAAQPAAPAAPVAGKEPAAPAAPAAGKAPVAPPTVIGQKPAPTRKAPAARPTTRKPAAPVARKAPAAGVTTPTVFCDKVTAQSLKCMEQRYKAMKNDPKKKATVLFFSSILTRFRTNRQKYVKKCVTAFADEQKKRKAAGKSTITASDLSSCWDCMSKAGCDTTAQKACSAICTKSKK